MNFNLNNSSGGNNAHGVIKGSSFKSDIRDINNNRISGLMQFDNNEGEEENIGDGMRVNRGSETSLF